MTSERIVWGPFWTPHRIHTLRFADLTSYAEAAEHHRYRLTLRHHPVERIEWALRRRFLTFEWGNTESLYRRRTTTFRFSRSGTDAAVAIRSRLAEAGVSSDPPVVIPVPPREERNPATPLVHYTTKRSLRSMHRAMRRSRRAGMRAWWRYRLDERARHRREKHELIRKLDP